jgi:sialate O-acetylesterase
MRIVLIFLLIPQSIVLAQLSVAKIFSDNMVLQMEQPIHIWGKGNPGREVVIAFLGIDKKVLTKPDSSWNVFFAKQAADPKPQAVTIRSGGKQIELKNVLIGDVWLCLGQSNMQWPMKQEMHYKNELADAHKPMLRFFNPSYAGEIFFGTPFSDSVMQRLNINDFYKGSWQSSDSLTFRTMSAVGYYFGKSVLTSEEIPVGLIDLSIGGAPIETFINKEAMKAHADFASKVNSDWLTNESLPVWARERGNQNVGGQAKVVRNNLGANHPFKPGFAFAAGIQPLFSFPIKGIIWYQGESNAQELERVNEYASLLKLMVDDYRQGWRQPRLPFYWVQLSSIDTVKYKGHLWPQFRDEQRKMLSKIPDGGMAVCSDMGEKDNVHPTNKKLVGERLARWALNRTYNRDIVPSGPLPLKATYVNGRVVIYFIYANGLHSQEGESLAGFSLDGKVEAHATIEKDKVTIRTKVKPDYVYYGWRPFSNGNLVNKDHLPASTFKIAVQ